MDPSRLRSTKRAKACDACKTRKVRCSGYPSPCVGCSKRGLECVFGRRKVPLRKNVNKGLITTVSPSPAPNESFPKPFLGTANIVTDQDLGRKHVAPIPIPDHGLYIDQILSKTLGPEETKSNRLLALKGNGLFGGTYTLTFFSDSRLASLAAKLQNNKVDELVKRFSEVIKSKVKSPDKVSARSISQERGRNSAFNDRAAAAAFISTYFEHVHPLYPHLNRASFETTAFSADLPTILIENKAFSALYHSVVALGCLYDGGGSFEPGKGKAWQIFSISLALFPELVQSPDSLLILQALTTMSIYSLGISCLAIEKFILTEAARRAQNLSHVIMSGSAAQTFRRTFWVLYSLEKMMSFFSGRNSVFIDVDITTPIPSVPESMFGAFDWFLTFARLSRLLSRTLSSLLSSGVSNKDTAYYVATLDQLNLDLEQWRMALPEDRRPGCQYSQHVLRKPVSGVAVFWTYYLYYGFHLILSKTYLQLTANEVSDSMVENRIKARQTMTSVSRTILELTPYIDVEPSTPLWVIAGIPIFALFILFEEVINDPQAKDAASNLALLDIAGGHFSRIEYASGGSLPGSLIAEFSYIAREYANEINRHSPRHHGPSESISTTVNHAVLGGAQLQIHSTVPISAEEQSTTSVLQTLPSAMSMHDPDFYSVDRNVPSQDSWGVETDALLGINVMDIFGGFVPLTEFQ